MRMLLMILGLSAALAGSAQEQPDIFANPTNLKVLPEDITSAELRQTMRGFAMDLGLRCESCHVGESGQPLDTFDFAADEKALKDTARVMLRMVRAINTEHLGRLDDPRLEVTCLTCHRGVQRPATTGQVLHDVLAQEGLDAAIAHYRELRSQYHGTHSYDFSEAVLADLAQTVARQTDPPIAMALLELNDEFFPRSFRNHWLKGEVALLNDDTALARKNFERALEIGADPRSEAYLRQRLDALP